MDDIVLPEFIDLNFSTEKLVEKLMEKQAETNAPAETPAEKPAEKRTPEYNSEIEALILKSTVLNHIALMQEMNDSEDKTLIHQMVNNLKNMIILHGRHLFKIIDIIESALAKMELDFNRFVIHKMIDNIRKNKHSDNLWFRDVNINISNTPPIPVEERKLIESKLPQFNYSKQIKKAMKPFAVNQIVGAKDKENRWWLSRILHVHDSSDSENYWYHVRFEGWGSLHDEWINNKTYRVRAYNPRKHFLKR